MQEVLFMPLGLTTVESLAVIYRRNPQKTSSASLWSYVGNVRDLSGDWFSEYEMLYLDRPVPICPFQIDNLLVFEVSKDLQQTSDAKISLSEMNRAKATKRWDAVREAKVMRQDFYQRMMSAKKQESRLSVSVQWTGISLIELLRTELSTSLGPLACSILSDCLGNATRGRPCYSENVWNVAMLLSLTSAKTYHILRQIFTLPSVSGLYQRFGEQLSAVKAKITDLRFARDILLKVAKSAAKLPQPTQYTLAVDAFSFRTFASTKLATTATETNQQAQNPTTVKLNNGFIFLLVPHDYRVPIKLVHLAAAPSGSYNATIHERTEFILNTAREVGLRVTCQATDGYPGVSSLHEDFYDKHVLENSGNYGELITNIWTWLCEDKTGIMPVSDPLHVWKNIRSRLISRPICLFDKSVRTDIESIKQTLDLGPALDDVSHIGKMRDVYVLKLFTFENVSKLLGAGNYIAAFVLLPFAAWLLVVFSTRIDDQLRLFLCELSFQLLSRFLSEFDTLQAAGVQQKACDPDKPCTLTEAHSIRRMLNTLAACGCVIFYGPNKLRMDSLGTHLVENAIGIARSTSFDPRYERVLTTFAHNELRKEIAIDNGITLYVQARINKGGCKIDTSPDADEIPGTSAKKPEGWSVTRILQLAKCMCTADIAPAMRADILQFKEEIDLITSSLESYDENVNPVANNGIIARLIAFDSA